MMALNAELGLTMDRLVQFAQAVLAAEKAQPAGEEAPDGAHEALQRLIENAGAMGPASREDALLVAKWRRPLLSPRPPAAPAEPPRGLDIADAIDPMLPFSMGHSARAAVDVLLWQDLAARKPPKVYTPPAAPAAEPLTDERIVATLKGCDKEDHTQEGWIWRTRIKWSRAIERACAEKWGVKLASGGEVQRG